MQLSDQWVLVTGGARGLGEAITRALAREGHAAQIVKNLSESREPLLTLCATPGATCGTC